MRRYLIIALTLMTPLAAAGSAQAVVVNDGGTQAGVALVPGTSLPAGVMAVHFPCANPPDPGLPGDLSYQAGTHPLCWHGGEVLHQNETYALTWDPLRRYWDVTRGYVEQFLRDVATSSGGRSSPFAVATQYWDGAGVADRAQNSSVYGGGCVDFGGKGGYTCQFGNSNGSGNGRDYTQDCSPSSPSDTCVTDAQIAQEVNHIAQEQQLAERSSAGHQPLVVVLMPPNVEVCLDTTGNLCSANSSASGRFCSYHGLANGLSYVVQPWTTYTGCDEPKLPALPPNPTPEQLSVDAGTRLVNPLSQSEIAAIVNPLMNGWFVGDGSSLDGSETDDNYGCAMGGPQTDTVPIGSGSYVLRREWNNTAAIESDPFTYFGCAPDVVLTPQFVTPAMVNAGDVVELDGSATASTLAVSKDSYEWSFGDGQNATGPSVTHVYAHGGTYTVKLTVTDRGGNTETLSQTIQVLGSNGQPVSTNSSSKGKLHVRILLMPQGLHQVLDHGVMLRVRSNEKANGVAWVSISRSLAKRAGIKAGHKPSVVIGVGTVSGITNGTVSLHLKLSRSVVAKLRHVSNVTLTVRLSLVGTGGNRVAVDAAGRY